MYYRITKLDGRFAGSHKFQYRIEFVKSNLISWHPDEFPMYEDYFIVRNWCIETFGHSCEREMLSKVKLENPQWAWHTNLNSDDFYIYLQGDKELSFLQLKFQVDQK